jgi:2-amino-4-hydroxy-6-hydroxymethyldihydropteridine diphosphokinase
MNNIVVYLGLGSSLGDREQNLQDALTRLHCEAVEVVRVSPIYESPHLGLKPGDETRYPPHLNCVAEIHTSLTAEELLTRLRAAEEQGGRQRTEKWSPRTIDLDILLFGQTALHTDALTIPHPGLTHRAFVVLPLLDLAPDLVLPDGTPLADIAASPEIQNQTITKRSTYNPTQ